MVLADITGVPHKGEQFDGFNANRFYPPKYDRTHGYKPCCKLSTEPPRWKSTLVFSYATGQAYTRVLGRAEVENPFSTTPEATCIGRKG